MRMTVHESPRSEYAEVKNAREDWTKHHQECMSVLRRKELSPKHIDADKAQCKQCAHNSLLVSTPTDGKAAIPKDAVMSSLVTHVSNNSRRNLMSRSRNTVLSDRSPQLGFYGRALKEEIPAVEASPAARTPRPRISHHRIGRSLEAAGCRELTECVDGKLTTIRKSPTDHDLLCAHRVSVECGKGENLFHQVFNLI